MKKQLNKDTRQTLAATAAGAIGGTAAALGLQNVDGLFPEDEEDGEITLAAPAYDPGAPSAQDAAGGDQEKAYGSHVSQEDTGEGDVIIYGVAFDSDGDGLEDAMAYDLNDDGVLDALAIVLDTDSDGVIDAVVVGADRDGDGVMEVAQLDLNGDGVMDAVAMDYNQDGIMEYAGVDTDGDHVAESHLVDTNADSSYDLIIRDEANGEYEGGDQSESDYSGSNDIAYDMDNDADVSEWC